MVHFTPQKLTLVKTIFKSPIYERLELGKRGLGMTV